MRPRQDTADPSGALPRTWSPAAQRPSPRPMAAAAAAVEVVGDAPTPVDDAGAPVILPREYAFLAARSSLAGEHIVFVAVVHHAALEDGPSSTLPETTPVVDFLLPPSEDHPPRGKTCKTTAAAVLPVVHAALGATATAGFVLHDFPRGPWSSPGGRRRGANAVPRVVHARPGATATTGSALHDFPRGMWSWSPLGDRRRGTSAVLRVVHAPLGATATTGFVLHDFPRGMWSSVGGRKRGTTAVLPLIYALPGATETTQNQLGLGRAADRLGRAVGQDDPQSMNTRGVQLRSGNRLIVS